MGRYREHVRKQAGTRHGLLLEAPMELRYTYPPPSSDTAAGGGAVGGLGGGAGGGVGVGVGGGGGGGGGGAALPTASGDNQPTSGALHKDTSLRALVEGGGGLRVTLLTLRCGFTPAWSPDPNPNPVPNPNPHPRPSHSPNPNPNPNRHQAWSPEQTYRRYCAKVRVRLRRRPRRRLRLRRRPRRRLRLRRRPWRRLRLRLTLPRKGRPRAARGGRRRARPRCCRAAR